jgi:hypothetical protein
MKSSRGGSEEVVAEPEFIIHGVQVIVLIKVG